MLRHDAQPSDVVTDADLVVALRAGQDWACEYLVRTHGGRLLAVARRICRNDEDARDVVQSAYLNAFRSLERFEGTSQFSTWLHRIVVNTALMKLRVRRRKPEESIDALLPAFQEDGHHVEQFSDWTLPADTRIEREECRDMVRTCIAQLPENYRQVLLLRDIEELSTEEAARVLHTTTGVVKVRLHRARQALSTLIRRQAPELSARA